MKNRINKNQEDSSFWVAYTDLLSNSLLILIMTIVVASLARASNEKPPLLRLTEQESFRFGTGSYLLKPEFIDALDQRLPEIRENIARYRIDTVEVIGHTDGQPSPGSSNLDMLLPDVQRRPGLRGFQPGSNTELGLMRALAVSNYLRLKLDASGLKGINIRPYSAGSLIESSGFYSPADTKDRANRRRIELRFTRQEDDR